MADDLQQLNNEDDSAENGVASNNPPIDGEKVAEPSPKNKKLNKVIDIVLWVLIVALALAVVFRAFIFTRITVSGVSMMTTYHDKEVVGVSKVKKPHRGDVVIFYKEDGSNKFLDIFGSGKSGDDDGHTKLIKRVVALAGDKLWVELLDGMDNVYQVVIETVDGDIIYEDYYKRDGVALKPEDFYIHDLQKLGILAEHIGQENALEIPANFFFAMGDNRANSSDSRYFRAVPMSRLYGVVVNT